MVDTSGRAAWGDLSRLAAGKEVRGGVGRRLANIAMEDEVPGGDWEMETSMDSSGSGPLLASSWIPKTLA
jgi:hypothetical protein